MQQPGPAGVWRLGRLLQADSPIPQLQDSPLALIACSHSHQDTLALCKLSLLDTYDHVNEYTEIKHGCRLRTSDQSKCNHSSVVIVPVLSGSAEQLQETLSGCAISSKRELEVYVGTTRPLRPTLFLVSHHFLTTYGFFHKESVWFRDTTPLPLGQVILVPVPQTNLELTDSHVEQAVAQLSAKCQKEAVITQQDFNFVFSVTFSDQRAPLQLQGQNLPDMSSQMSSQMSRELLTFRVLECSPVRQGKIAEDTVVAVLPPDELPSPSPSPSWCRGGPVFSSGEYTIRERASTSEGSEEEETYRDTSSSANRGRSLSAFSASDFKYEESLLNLAERASSGGADYLIEAVAVSSFKLQSQCIVLPRQTAEKHGIFASQLVLVSAITVEDRQRKRQHPLADVVLPLEKGGKGHMAIAVWYEGEQDLERYVLPPSLGHGYREEDLDLAYVHPELLFSLFPETLSPSRRFHLHIQCISPSDIPLVEKIVLYPVKVPEQLPVDVKDVLPNYLTKTLHVNEGDVFGVRTDLGRVFYKITSLEPKTEEGAGTIDGSAYREFSVVKENIHSYRCNVVPPSPLLSPLSYWEHTRPPGLEKYCDALFSFLIPLLSPSERPLRRSPSVLISGPSGVGKRTVVKAVARQCRMHVLEYNCFEYSGVDVLGQAFVERRLFTNMEAAMECAPAIIMFNHIHKLGRKDNQEEEPRVSSAFEVCMEKVNEWNRNNRHPVVVVGMTAKPRLLSPRVHSCFLQQLELPSPSLSQREAMLGAIARLHPASPEINWAGIAKRTAGFVLGDLAALFSLASHTAYREVTSYCYSKLGYYQKEDLAVSGVVLMQNHLETALDSLHSSHSDAIGAPKIPNVQWDDVGGLEEAKQDILDTIQLPLSHPELFPPGLRRSGVLLYGAPGTGKTLLAKAVATECSLNFLSVKGPELINMYVGQSEENVREVFTRARSAAPCVIFFDELDSIAPNRGKSGDSGGVMDRVVSQLLAELDGLQKSEDVFVIGATNRPDLLDPALLRPGRFDRLVCLGISEEVESKVKILKAICRKFNLGEDVDLQLLAAQCPVNVTGADLYALCSDALLTALRRQIEQLERQGLSDDQWEGTLVVGQGDLLEALGKLKPSVSPAELQRYQDLKSTMRS